MRLLDPSYPFGFACSTDYRKCVGAGNRSFGDLVDGSVPISEKKPDCASLSRKDRPTMRHWKTTAALLVATVGLAGCRSGGNPFGLRNRSRVPYVAERPIYGQAPGNRQLGLAGYAGHNYGPPPVVAPVIRRAP
jgi:hypothetical protein